MAQYLYPPQKKLLDITEFFSMKERRLGNANENKQKMASAKGLATQDIPTSAHRIGWLVVNDRASTAPLDGKEAGYKYHVICRTASQSGSSLFRNRNRIGAGYGPTV